MVPLFMNWMKPTTHKVNEKASFAPLLNEVDDDEQQQHSKLHHLLQKKLLVFNGLLFIASFSCFVISGILYLITHGDDSVLRQKTFSSPVVNTFSPTWHPSEYRTYPLNSPASIFRQDPSPAVDAAWERVHKIGVLPITSADVRHLGKDPATVIQTPLSWNLPPDTHLAHLDGLHLIHCLNSMRKSLHQNYHHYFHDEPPEIHHAHLSHCQEALAKHLMCQPSLELITYAWAEGRERPFPDFDITRKCYDFEALLDWQEEHQVKDMRQEKWDELKRPEGSGALPVPILMKEVWDARNATREGGELFVGPE